MLNSYNQNNYIKEESSKLQTNINSIINRYTYMYMYIYVYTYKKYILMF